MRASGGFTLIEVVVALALGAGVVLLAHRIVVGLTDASVRLTALTESDARSANARRLLARIVSNIDVHTSDTLTFRGDTSAVRFSSWTVDAQGWPSLRVFTLARLEDSLVLSGLEGGPLFLMGQVGVVQFDYLLELGENARWMRRWSGSLSVPLALRLRLVAGGHADTLLLPIGPRG